MQKSSFFERSPIRLRTQSDQIANAAQSDCERERIGLRSENDDKSLVLNTPL